MSAIDAPMGDDRRIFPRERRVGERRAPPRGNGFHDTDPHIALPDFEEIVIELVEADIEAVEQTLVRERRRPRPWHNRRAATDSRGPPRRR